MLTALTFGLVIVFVIASIVVDRVWCEEGVAIALLLIAKLLLIAVLSTFIMPLLLGGLPPSEAVNSGFIEFMRWMAAELGGWAPVIAIGYFFGAGASCALALFAFLYDHATSDVLVLEAEDFLIMALIESVCGIVFLVGFFVFFEAIAVLLGIVASILGIIIALKKLSHET